MIKKINRKNNNNKKLENRLDEKLHFYKNVTKGRLICYAKYINGKREYLCACSINQKAQAQKYFEKLKTIYDEDIESIKKDMKKKFKLKTGKPKLNSIHEDEKLYFYKHKKSEQRLACCVNLDGKQTYLCGCNLNQKAEAQEHFDKLKTIYDDDIESIKKDMKKKFNKRNLNKKSKINKSKSNKSKPIKKPKSKDNLFEKLETSWIDDFSTNRNGDLLFRQHKTHLIYLDLLDLRNFYTNYKGKIGGIARLYPSANKIVLRILLENIKTKEFNILFKKLEKECAELNKNKRNIYK